MTENTLTWSNIKTRSDWLVTSHHTHVYLLLSDSPSWTRQQQTTLFYFIHTRRFFLPQVCNSNIYLYPLSLELFSWAVLRKIKLKIINKCPKNNGSDPKGKEKITKWAEHGLLAAAMWYYYRYDWFRNYKITLWPLNSIALGTEIFEFLLFYSFFFFSLCPFSLHIY